VEVEVRGPTLEAVVAELGGFGARVEVTAPLEARQRLRALAEELGRVYGEADRDGISGASAGAR
jgi:predicted DNA-binding transcriptional regulator YafY